MSTKVCGWCGQPLAHWGTPPEDAETCEQVYGSVCSVALDYYSQMLHEAEMQRQEDIDEYNNQRMVDYADTCSNW